MKKFAVAITLFFIVLNLISCASNFNPTLRRDLTAENWKRLVVTNPGVWKRGADIWFLTGQPNRTELENRRAENQIGMSTMKVNAGAFSTLRVSGAFQVQIFGSESNSIYIYGPNSSAHAIAVENAGDILSVRQTEVLPQAAMQQVIVRIGVRNLRRLEQQGEGSIEAINLNTCDLVVSSTGVGNIYLSGNIGLRQVIHNGGGCINIFGAVSRRLAIDTAGSGSVNICGKVGVRSIVHHGCAEINIVGATSDGLTIYGDGSGIIGICGYVALCSVIAKDDMQIYINNSYSDRINATVSGNARLGIIGKANELHLNVCDYAIFSGRFLCTRTAYVKTYDSAHANVSISDHIYASAERYSTIYYFGPANLMVRFGKGSGIVIPIEDKSGCNSNREYRPYAYTRGYPADDVFVAPGAGECMYKGAG